MTVNKLTIMDDVNQKKYSRTNMNVDNHDGPNQLIRSVYLGLTLKTKNKRTTHYEQSHPTYNYYYNIFAYNKCMCTVCGSLCHYSGYNECVCDFVVIHSPNVRYVTGSLDWN